MTDMPKKENKSGGTGTGGALLKTLYDSLDDKYAQVVAKASATAVGWGLLVAGVAAGVWAFGATGGSFADKLGPFVAAGLTAVLWGGACAAIGVGLGFLFGVPRSGPTYCCRFEDRPSYQRRFEGRPNHC